MTTGRLISAGATAIIGLLLGAVIAMATGTADVSAGDATPPPPEDSVTGDEETTATTEPESDDASPDPTDDPGTPDVVDSSTVAPAELEPLDLDAIRSSINNVVGVEALGCGGVSWSTAFNDSQSGIYDHSLATHSWRVSQLSPLDGQIVANDQFLPLQQTIGAGRLVRSSSISAQPFANADFDIVIGMDVAVVGVRVEPNQVFGSAIQGTVQDIGANGPVINFDQQPPATFYGAPVVAGGARLVGVFTDTGVVGLQALGAADSQASNDCRTATHDLSAAGFRSAKSTGNQEILVAQNFVDLLGANDWATVEAIDIGRSRTVNWASDFAPFDQGLVLPIRQTGSGWRFLYHTFEGRDSRDAGQHPGFGQINRMFCVTWVADATNNTVNQQTARDTHRPNSNDGYPFWNRIDGADSRGLVNANDLVEDFRNVC